MKARLAASTPRGPCFPSGETPEEGMRLLATPNLCPVGRGPSTTCSGQGQVLMSVATGEALAGVGQGAGPPVGSATTLCPQGVHRGAVWPAPVELGASVSEGLPPGPRHKLCEEAERDCFHQQTRLLRGCLFVLLSLGPWGPKVISGPCPQWEAPAGARGLELSLRPR